MGRFYYSITLIHKTFESYYQPKEGLTKDTYALIISIGKFVVFSFYVNSVVSLVLVFVVFCNLAQPKRIRLIPKEYFIFYDSLNN